MSRYTALLDANILYPAPLRDIFMELAVTDIYHAKWTADIHREWIEALLRENPEIERSKLERTRDLMDAHVRDALVTGYEHIIPSLELPDSDDRHVLAAAIVGRCDVIVTKNLTDFPDEALAQYHIEAQHPDVFLMNQFHLARGIFIESIRIVRSRLKNPPYTAHDYLDVLLKHRLVTVVTELEAFIDSI